jgi:DNA polymerase III epsilon subunit-like protein
MRLLFFDTETNAIGKMSKPVTQTLMQISWVITDRNGAINGIQNRFVKGAACVGPHAPHGLTPAFVEENGDEPGVVLADFLEDCRDVAAGGGKIVAHNLDFDVGVVEHALGEPFPECLSSHGFCTMKDLSIMSFYKRKTGVSRYPSLSKLYAVLFGSDPTETLHDALGDTHVLRKNFHKLLELGVISFPPDDDPVISVTPKLVNRADCDFFINASDVSTLSGLLSHFGRYPHEVAERVLGKFGGAFSVSGVGTAPGYSVAQDKVQDMLETAGAMSCANTSVLGKREREMHAEIDQRGDITPAVAREAKRLVSSRLARSYGTAQEPAVVEAMRIQDNNKDTFHLGCGEVCGLKWGLVGKVDGFSGGRLVEVKSRKRRFLGVADYELVQLEIYMRMTGVDEVTLIESLTDARGTSVEEHRKTRDDGLWSVILAECGCFARSLSKLTQDPVLWEEWCGADAEARKSVWAKCV